MMTPHKLLAGDGYTYLTRHVASADDRPAGQTWADYYTQTGNPPGLVVVAADRVLHSTVIGFDRSTSAACWGSEISPPVIWRTL